MEKMDSKLGFLKKIKTLVSRTGKSILWRGRTKDNEISEKIAQKIQKSSYDFSMRVVKDSFAPPYLKLAEQLQIEDNQIFRAAAYNMANIAVARPKYRREIVTIFEKLLKDPHLDYEKQEYLRKKVNFINAARK